MAAEHRRYQGMASPHLISQAELALRPFRAAGAPGNDLRASLATFPNAWVNEFAVFLERNGLAPLWFRHIHHYGLQNDCPDEFIAALRAATIAATATHAQQILALHDALECLCKAEVPTLAIKGLPLRLELYEEPQLRPALDIDLLVDAEHRNRAICALTRHGMQPQPEAASIDHELSFIFGNAAIDLHWQLFRTGRSDTELTREMFEQQTVLNGIPSAGATHSLYLMLTHPVITNYPLTELSLIRLVDINRWLGSRKTDWDAILSVLARYRTRTAAWLSLTLTQRFLGTAVPADIMRDLSPGPARSRYLLGWVEQDLSTRLQRHSTLRKLGYSLPLYDSLSDAVSGTRQYLASQAVAETAVEECEALIAECMDQPTAD